MKVEVEIALRIYGLLAIAMYLFSNQECGK